MISVHKKEFSGYLPISNHCHLSKEKYRKEKFENGIFFGIIKKIPIGYFLLMVVKNRFDLKTQAELKYVNLFIKKEAVQRRINWNIFKAKKEQPMVNRMRKKK